MMRALHILFLKEHFLHDLCRFAVCNSTMVDEAPFQTYLAAMLFVPSQSTARRTSGIRLGRYLGSFPVMEPQIAGLVDGNNAISALTISADSMTVVSGSRGSKVQLRSTTTCGTTLQLDGHESMVTAVRSCRTGRP